MKPTLDGAERLARQPDAVGACSGVGRRAVLEVFVRIDLQTPVQPEPAVGDRRHAQFPQCVGDGSGDQRRDKRGFGSPLFAVSTVLAMVVMYDAAGIRQAAGKQAAKINLIVEELLNGHPLNEEHLRELLGHTPLQVAVGALVGFVGALLLNA